MKKIEINLYIFESKYNFVSKEISNEFNKLFLLDVLYYETVSF